MAKEKTNIKIIERIREQRKKTQQALSTVEGKEDSLQGIPSQVTQGEMESGNMEVEVIDDSNTTLMDTDISDIVRNEVELAKPDMGTPIITPSRRSMRLEKKRRGQPY